ncbi:hypothetical protein AALA61_09915 [Oscillospiraceae bacterium 42-9]
MEDKITQEKLLIPVYINEKIVLDMLAILEDGFSTVSQVNYSEHKECENRQKGGGGVSTSATIWSKLFKIDLSGEFSHTGRKDESENTVKEKVHTNVSLLSKFRTFLVKEKILKPDFDIKKISIGDFVEVEGELEKNPLIEYMDKSVDVFRMADIFSTEPELGNKTQAKQKKQQEQALLKQLESFAGELKHSSTVDFILSDNKGTIVLSAQEKYLSNDNISEILGGRFKVLGKVIAICKDDSENIDLFRKTTLSILSDDILSEALSAFQNEDFKQFNLPTLNTKIYGPAVIVIPIAIYA